MAYDPDKKIMAVFRRMNRRNMTGLTVQTLTAMTGIEQQLMYKRLESLTRYGLVKSRQGRMMKIWELEKVG